MTNEELIAKIKAEIERHLNSATEHQNANPDMPKYRWYLYEGEKELCTDLLGYIDDSLESEKPMQEGLEEEIKSWIPSIKVKVDEDVRGIMKHIREWGELIARHFAEWQKEQMLKEAVEGIVMNFSSKEPQPTVIVDAKGFNQGDRVRVIVLPKED